MFLHTFHPSPVFFDFGFFSIHWYGLIITLAIVLGFFITRKLFKIRQSDTGLVYDLGFYLIIFSLLGARLWHVASEFGYYQKNPLDILKIWNGGLAIHGVLLFGLLALGWYYRRHRQKFNVNFLCLLDIFAPAVVLGQAIGRWGNYFNQELFGRPFSGNWSIPIDFHHRLAGYVDYNFFHPIFLYESLWCFFVFALLMYFHQRRNKDMQPTKKSFIARYSLPLVSMPGFIFLAYLFLYSLERFLIGFLRIDAQIGWLNLRLDQWVSLVIIIFSLVFFLSHKRTAT